MIQIKLRFCYNCFLSEMSYHLKLEPRTCQVLYIDFNIKAVRYNLNCRPLNINNLNIHSDNNITDKRQSMISTNKQMLYGNIGRWWWW